VPLVENPANRGLSGRHFQFQAARLLVINNYRNVLCSWPSGRAAQAFSSTGRERTNPDGCKTKGRVFLLVLELGSGTRSFFQFFKKKKKKKKL
jgi:hypothetical protein